MKTVEANLDGLVGPTHNYAGLSFGNVASEKFALTKSNPKQAALQGLRKMKFLHDLGIPQLVMPPQPRPDFAILKRLGFNDITKAPAELLHPLYSASGMWTANAASISPGADTQDGKVHITPANLLSKFHRAIETPVTAHYLKQIFPGEHFVHHEPLPSHAMFADEGAANHMRLASQHEKKGTEIFVYGGAAKKYPARQTRASVEAIGRLHGLDESHTVFLEQSAEAIDAGVFHNDVIAMSNESLFIYHEKAYAQLDKRLNHFTSVVITEKELPLADAVSTYFFNSQLVTLPSGGMAIIAPKECEEYPATKAIFNKFVSNGHIRAVHYLDVRESMKNGGGPACLRLRIVLNESQLASVNREVLLTDALYVKLCEWIEAHYRDNIKPDDLRDPLLAEQAKCALSRLSQILSINIRESHDDR